MSVLIEAVTLVVPKVVLDRNYPGGSEAYCLRLLELPRPPRFICAADPELINVSFYDPPHVTLATELLDEHNIVGVDDDMFVEYALVDQQEGPVLRCPWLEWEVHEDGFTVAWRTGNQTADMAAPAGWTVEQSKALVRAELRGGDQSDIKGSAPLKSVSDSLNTPNPLLAVIIEAMSAQGLSGMQEVPDTIAYRVHGSDATYDVFFLTDESTQVLICYCLNLTRIPEKRRAAVSAAITRVNADIPIGNFELEFDDGELRTRVSIDVEGAEFVPKMAENMLASSMQLWSKFHGPLMRVAFGDVDPAEAIRDAIEDGDEDVSEDGAEDV